MKMARMASTAGGVAMAAMLFLAAGCGEPGNPVAPVRKEPPVVEPPEPSVPGDPAKRAIHLATAEGVVTARISAGDAPAWSPDGRRIAFVREGGVHVMDADGANVVRLRDGVQPAWSPDGTRIVFNSNYTLHVMKSDGSGVITIPSDSGIGVGYPAWSPDGTSIAYVQSGDFDMVPEQVYVMKSDGTQPRRLTPLGRFQYAESFPTWSPDGSVIAFWSYGFGVALVSSEGGEPSRVHQDFPKVAYWTKPSWSPDGSSLLFNKAATSASSQSSVWTVSRSGTGARVLIADGYDAVWSPDGARIAFVRWGAR